MKKDTHPTYFPKATVKCACGANYQFGSTVKEVKVDVCSNCHPFYTGKQKLVDTARRVEKFEAKTAKQAQASKTRAGKTTKKAKLKAKRSTKVGVRKVVKKIGSARRKTSVDKAKKPAKPKLEKKAVVPTSPEVSVGKAKKDSK